MMRRKNGFECPLHPVQVTGWVVFSSDVAIFAAICLPELQELVAQLLIGCVFGASVIVLVGAAAFATSCDPVDPRVRAVEMGRTGKEDEGDLPFCNTCCAHVRHNSKHCRVCNKCVHGFDHHCIWFNNCVGEHNYWAFATAIGSVAVMTGTMIAVSVYLFFQGVLNDDVEEGIVAASVCMLLVNVPLFLLDMQLVLFHMFLTSKGWTTYDYVLQKQDDSMSWAQYAMTCCMELLVIRKIRDRRKKAKPSKKAAEADEIDAKAPPSKVVDGAPQVDSRRDSQESTGPVVVVGTPPQEESAALSPQDEDSGPQNAGTGSATCPETIEVEVQDAS
mmetsp:Transcript_3486/g.8675  ORF Transcript_3486/g.8675 Transcript_3486/m.8675 type:complete len:332 (+) Transcript_3486:86-1081(+)